MSRSVAIRTLILAVFAAMPLSYACSGDVGVVPQCEPDVGEAGIQIVDGGCSRFAVCLNDAGGQVPVTECCKDYSSCWWRERSRESQGLVQETAP